MKVTIEAGAEIDIATPHEIMKIVQAQQDKKAIRIQQQGTVTIPTPTALAMIDLGGPPQGYRWDVRHVTICGVDPTVSFTGTGLVCIGTPMLPKTNTTLDPFVVWSASTTLPADVSYGADQAVVQGTEHLFIVVSGGTAATIAAAHAQVFEEPLKSVEYFIA